jgi:hypothetical protein
VCKKVRLSLFTLFFSFFLTILVHSSALVMMSCQPLDIIFISDLNRLSNVWFALFGSGEESVAARIRPDYWDDHWKMIPARRGVLDVVHSIRVPLCTSHDSESPKSVHWHDTGSTVTSSEDWKTYVMQPQYPIHHRMHSQACNLVRCRKYREFRTDYLFPTALVEI